MENRKFLTEALLGTLFIILSSGLLIYEGFKETKSLAETEVEQIAVSIESGAALYVAACSECHGPDGRGGIGAPLNDPHLFDLGPEGRLAELGFLIVEPLHGAGDTRHCHSKRLLMSESGNAVPSDDRYSWNPSTTGRKRVSYP